MLTYSHGLDTITLFKRWLFLVTTNKLQPLHGVCFHHRWSKTKTYCRRNDLDFHTWDWKTGGYSMWFGKNTTLHLHLFVNCFSDFTTQSLHFLYPLHVKTSGLFRVTEMVRFECGIKQETVFSLFITVINALQREPLCAGCRRFGVA